MTTRSSETRPENAWRQLSDVVGNLLQAIAPATIGQSNATGEKVANR